MSKQQKQPTSSLLVFSQDYPEDGCFRSVPKLGKDIWIYDANDNVTSNDNRVIKASPGDWISARDIVLGFQRLRDIEFKKLHLSPREKEVAAFLLDGESNARIAKTMYLTLAAVKYHVHNVFKKSGSSSREELFHLMKSRMESSNHVWLDLSDYVNDIYQIRPQSNGTITCASSIPYKPL